MSSVVPPDATPFVTGFSSFSTRVIFGQWIYTDGTGVATPPTISYVGAPYYLSAAQATMFAKQSNATIASAIGDSTVGVWWAEVLVFDDPDVVGDVAVRISHSILPGGGITIAVPKGDGSALNIANALQVVGAQGGLMVVGYGGAAWAEITGKPDTFPPSTHSHLWADITDKPATFAPAAHSHDWASITAKPAVIGAGATQTAALAALGITVLEANDPDPTIPGIYIRKNS